MLMKGEAVMFSNQVHCGTNTDEPRLYLRLRAVSSRQNDQVGNYYRPLVILLTNEYNRLKVPLLTQ